MRDLTARRGLIRWRAGCAIVLGLASPAAFAQTETDETTADERAIIVTGTRLGEPDLESASPTQTVAPEAFVLTGVANVEQTLNQLPQLVPGFTTTSNNPGTGAATLDLRGLGSVRTLILVNGRRWIASDAGQVPEVDVNTIPAALIERVDIVTGGASAVYGSDAVTGVINFVLKDKLEGVHLDVRQALTERGDGRTSSADLSLGTRFLGGRGSLLASAGWLDQAFVTQADRRFSNFALADGCAVPGTRTPFGNSTPIPAPVSACAPPNEIAFIAGGSFNVPGTRIPNAFFPVAGTDRLVRNALGVRFDPDGTPRSFVPAFDSYNFAPGNFLQIGFERWSANLLASLKLAPAFEPYVELAYIETRSPQQLAPVPATIGGNSRVVPVVRINLDNPFLTAEARRILDLSYGVDAQGDRGFRGSAATGFTMNPAFGGDADGFVSPNLLQSRLVDLGPRQLRNRREARRGLVGMRGEIAAYWDYDLYFSDSHVEHTVAFANSGSALRLQQALLARRDPATGQIVCIDPSNGCVPANIFGAGNISATAADFIRTNPIDVTIIDEQVGEASVRGLVPLLPAGPAGLALGATWRRSGYDYAPDPSFFTGDDLGFGAGTPASGSTRVFELFGEARAPLLADRPWARELALELGLRYSDYDSVGGVWTWKALADWTPLAGLRLRGGYQRAVRAPNVRELFEQPVRGFAFFLDPCSSESGLLGYPAVVTACLRDGVPAALLGDTMVEDEAEADFRGNPEVEAEVARTLTLGLVVNPRAIPGLSLTLDYYDIRIRNAIGVLGGGGFFIVTGCIAGGGDPADPLCQAYRRDADGRVELFDLPTANLEAIRARGIDWQLGLRRAIGLFADDMVALKLSGTRYLESSFRPNRNAPTFDCGGAFGFPCGNTIAGSATPRWKLFNELSYTAGAATLALRHRWFSATRDARTVVEREFGYTFFRLPEEGRRLEGRHYFDLATQVRLQDRFDLTFGVNNLTDEKPAITGDNQVAANTNPSLYDVLGRRFFIALSAKLF